MKSKESSLASMCVTVHADNPALLQLKQMANFLPAYVRAGPRSVQAGRPHQAICAGETHGTPVKVEKKGDKFPSCVLAARAVCTMAPQQRVRLSGRCIMLLTSGLAFQADHFGSSQIITAAVTSADCDCVVFLSLTKTVLVNDCQRSVL